MQGIKKKVDILIEHVLQGYSNTFSLQLFEIKLKALQLSLEKVFTVNCQAIKFTGCELKHKSNGRYFGIQYFF